MSESILWMMANAGDGTVNEPEDKPPTITIQEYFQSLEDKTFEEKARALREKYPNLSISKLIRETGWTRLRHWLQPKEARDKISENNKAWIKKRRGILLDLKRGGCVRCGYNKCLDALQFHHTDPSNKTNNVSSIKRIDDMIAESKKCIVVCANCHHEIHSQNSTTFS